MKLAGRQAQAFCKSPDLSLLGALIHGGDAGQVMGARKRLMQAILGDPPDDLRVTRLEPAEVRRDGAIVLDSLRTQGFFPGRRVVLIEGLTDSAIKTLVPAIEAATPEDAFLIVTADALPARSAMRKLFEGRRDLSALQLFADAIDAQEVAGALAEHGARCGIDDTAAGKLAEATHSMDHGSAQQLLKLVATFALSQDEPLTVNDVERIIPRGLGADADGFVRAVASGIPDRIGPHLRRLAAEGVQAVTIVLALQRHFRQLLQASVAPGGPSAGLAALRPPAWGPRRDEMAGQLRRWNSARLEQACRILLDTDRQLRAANAKPAMAVLERAALRLAIMGSR